MKSHGTLVSFLNLGGALGLRFVTATSPANKAWTRATSRTTEESSPRASSSTLRRARGFSCFIAKLLARSECQLPFSLCLLGIIVLPYPEHRQTLQTCCGFTWPGNELRAPTTSDSRPRCRLREAQGVTTSLTGLLRACETSRRVRETRRAARGGWSSSSNKSPWNDWSTLHAGCDHGECSSFVF